MHERTANGDVFYPSHLTAASYAFPLGSYVKVTSQRTGRSLIVFINDRGPAKRLGRLIDLSQAAFVLLEGDLSLGLTTVMVEPVHA